MTVDNDETQNTLLCDRLPVVNPAKPHLPIVFLVDISASMTQDGAIDELNRFLQELHTFFRENDYVAGITDISIISFGADAKIELGFRSAEEYEVPTLSANGPTSMNQALLLAFSEIQARKDTYKQNGVKWYRPWLFVLTDGMPTDTVYENEAVQKITEAIENRKIKYVPVGIGSADIKQLQKYYPENYDQKIVLKADAKSFANLFSYLLIDDNDFPEPDDSLKLPITPSDIKLPEVPPDIIIDL